MATHTGTIKTLEVDRGFGFLQANIGTVFSRANDLVDRIQFVDLYAGQVATFWVEGS